MILAESFFAYVKRLVQKVGRFFVFVLVAEKAATGSLGLNRMNAKVLLLTGKGKFMINVLSNRLFNCDRN